MVSSPLEKVLQNFFYILKRSHVRIPHHRNNQSLIQFHGDPYVDCLALDNLIALHADIHSEMLFQSKA